MHTDKDCARPDECMKTDRPQDCRHKLSTMPRWLSSQKARGAAHSTKLTRARPIRRRGACSIVQVETVRTLLAEDPAMLCAPFVRTRSTRDARATLQLTNRACRAHCSLRESLGISADGSERAFRGQDIVDFSTREGPVVDYFARRPSLNTQHLFVAVDPSGGGTSAFSICTVIQHANGFFGVRSAARQARAHVRIWVEPHVHWHPEGLARPELCEGHGRDDELARRSRHLIDEDRKQ